MPMATKDELLKRKSDIEAQLAELRARRAGFERDLAEARAVAETEKRGFVQSLIGRGKHDMAKMVEARAKVEAMPDVLRGLDEQMLQASAPIAAIDLELDRLAAAEQRAEADRLIAELRAGVAALYATYARLSTIEQELGSTAAGSAVRPPVNEAAFRLRGVGMAKEILDFHDTRGY
jgi:hypothetical protein